MRRVLALLVVAAAIAVSVGLATSSSAAASIRVNGSTLTKSQLDQELEAIAHSPLYQCYLSARTLLATNGEQVAPKIETAGGSWTSGAIVEWGDLRVTQLVAETYVRARHASPASTPTGATSAELVATPQGRAYAARITADDDDASTTEQLYSCPAASGITNLGAATLESMPAWFVRQQLAAEVATDALARFTSQQPTTLAALRTWYASHERDFDTLCASAIVAPNPATAASVVRRIDAGTLTIAQAVDQPSLNVDTQLKSSHGSLGCYPPSSQSYAEVSHYVAAVPVGTATSFSNGGTVVVVVPTRKTPNAFSAVASQVASQVSALNATKVGELLTAAQRAATIVVSPELGRWVPNSLGGTLEPPIAPGGKAVLDPAADASS